MKTGVDWGLGKLEAGVDWRLMEAKFLIGAVVGEVAVVAANQATEGISALC